MKRFCLVLLISVLLGGIPLFRYAEASSGLYRLYNPRTNNHLYTTDYREAFELNDSGIYRLEGVVGNIFTEPVDGTVPLYRLYSPRANRHAFTAGESGLATLKRSGYRVEAIIAYIVANNQIAPLNGAYPDRVYWMQNSKTRDWLLTKDRNEALNAERSGFKESLNSYFVF